MDETYVVRTCGCRSGASGDVTYVTRGRAAAVLLVENIGPISISGKLRLRDFLETGRIEKGASLVIGEDSCPSGLRHFAEVTAAVYV